MSKIGVLEIIFRNWSLEQGALFDHGAIFREDINLGFIRGLKEFFWLKFVNFSFFFRYFVVNPLSKLFQTILQFLHLVTRGLRQKGGGVQGQFWMFGSYESTFHCWKATFYGIYIYWRYQVVSKSYWDMRVGFRALSPQKYLGGLWSKFGILDHIYLFFDHRCSRICD